MTVNTSFNTQKWNIAVRYTYSSTPLYDWWTMCLTGFFFILASCTLILYRYKGPFRLPYKTIRHQPSDKIRLTKTTKYSHIYLIYCLGHPSRNHLIAFKPILFNKFVPKTKDIQRYIQRYFQKKIVMCLMSDGFVRQSKRALNYTSILDLVYCTVQSRF